MTQPYDIHGVPFNVSDASVAFATNVFRRGTPQANDTGPYGHVTEIEAFIDRTKNLRNFVDVGSCYGVFSLVFTRSSDQRAYAIEPSPWAYSTLVRQVQVNPSKNIVLINRFADEVDGRSIPCNRDSSHIVPDANGGPGWHVKYFGKNLSREHLNMTGTRIDNMPEFDQMDCMKIDVEGWECSVIRGAEAKIRKWRPLIFLEAHTNTLPGHGESGDGLLKQMRDLEYRFERFDGTPETTLSDCSMKRLVCIPT